MIRGMISNARSTSESVVVLPNEKRRLARASSRETPMAVRTWEGLMEPLLQADPAEQQSPS